MIKMDFKGNITSKELPLFEGNNAYLKDFAISNDENAPITAGLFRLEKGESITYDYTYEEMKLIIDGEFHISDGSGEEITATKGDLIYFPKGSVITFRTDDFGLGYFVGQRGEDEA
ncbi:MAG: cupin domain-containing protein [Candidatus Pseudothioglobus sp.]|jgi:ethanolamine utilization protein EutQ (cupin superfamily)